MAAQTLMILKNYSQLSVKNEHDETVGAISWESIGRSRMSTRCDLVSDAYVAAKSVEYEADLVGYIDDIYRAGFVLVRRGVDITGIVTSADLTVQFGNFARPYVLLEEIELRLRKRVGQVMTDSDIERAKTFNAKEIGKLTFGAYSRLWLDDVHWLKLKWDNIEKDLFFKDSEECR